MHRLQLHLRPRLGGRADVGSVGTRRQLASHTHTHTHTPSCALVVLIAPPYLRLAGSRRREQPLMETSTFNVGYEEEKQALALEVEVEAFEASDGK